MVIDARTLEAGHLVETDLCIIGGGPAGLTIARELARRNVDVCVLESGGLDLEAETQDLCHAVVVGDRYDPAETRVRRFGGTAHAWVTPAADGPGGRFVPLDRIDFEERPYLPHSGWPFDRAHLGPYYERAQQLCGLGPYRYEAHDWTDAATPPLPFTGDRIRTATYQTGASHFFTRTYTDDVARAPTVKVYLHANVVELECDEAGQRVTAAHVACWRGARFPVRARRFVLATGGIENARLLLLSVKPQQYGLGNGHDLVGRFFMEHPQLFSCEFVPADSALFERMGFYDIHPSKGSMVGGRLALSESVMRQEQLLNMSVLLFPLIHGERSAARKALRRVRQQVREKALSAETLRLIGRSAFGIGGLLGYGYRRFVRGDNVLTVDGWSKQPQKARRFGSFEVILHLEQRPEPQNRVTLGRERDALGQSRAEIHWRWSAQDEASALRGRDILGEEIERSGLGRLVHDDEIVLRGSVHHHMGTTRMHHDPRNGVVDEHCRVHGVNNLFVAGSSVFPTGGYANPTLTIVALALRLADHLSQH